MSQSNIMFRIIYYHEASLYLPIWKWSKSGCKFGLSKNTYIFYLICFVFFYTWCCFLFIKIIRHCHQYINIVLYAIFWKIEMQTEMILGESETHSTVLVQCTVHDHRYTYVDTYTRTDVPTSFRSYLNITFDNK